MCQVLQLLFCYFHLSYGTKKLVRRWSLSLGISWMPASGKGQGELVNTASAPTLLRSLFLTYDA